MKLIPAGLSLRARLLLAVVAVNVVMMVLLMVNGISVMDHKLDERMRVHLEEQKQLLNAALSVPLAARQFRALAEILERVRADSGIVYLVLFDHNERLVASAGWEGGKPLPPPAVMPAPSFVSRATLFHTAMDVDSDGTRIGRLHFGLSTEFMRTARAELIRENLVIGGFALLLSVLSMIALSFWLTRNLVQLTRASDSLAAGDLNVRLPVEGGDEVGKLTHAFNVMAAALQSRIKALAENEAKFSAIADYSYDCECWISPEGKLIWINPRVLDMFGYTPEECLATENFPVSFVDEQDATRTVRQIRGALRGGTGQDYEFRGRRKDGSEFWAAADWRPIYDSHGGYLGIRISIRDITQRKEAERRLESTVVELRDSQVV